MAENNAAQSLDFKTIKTDELFKKFGASKDGLSLKEAEKRIKQYGLNEILEKRQSKLLKFLKYFWGPIPWMIEAAIFLSFLVHDWNDFVIILIMLLVNALAAFWQESKADDAITALKQKLALQATALRDGKWIQIPAKNLVPGDIINLRGGNIVPADAKIFEANNISVDESALTGESLPVEKNNGDIAYNSSTIRQGKLTAIVIGTGLDTFFGKTAKLVSEAKTKSHFEQTITRIAKYCVILASILLIITVGASLLRHSDLMEIIRFSLVLAVASIPATLPAILSITMAIGSIALAKKQAIVSKLSAIGELSGMDILCSDKTGTITKNHITIVRAVPYKKFTEADAVLYGCLSSKQEDNDPIDNAFLEFGKNIDFKKYKIGSFKPFDAISKIAEAEIKDNKKTFKVAKGAPQAVLALLHGDKEAAKWADKYVLEFAQKGYRAMAVAKNEKGLWKLAGMIALEDPPRDESKNTISEVINSLGVKIKLITGDHIAIAKEIAEEVGLGKNIVIPSFFENLAAEKKVEAAINSDGFAEVMPEDKYKIVNALQINNHIVGMTGDGVNDAPALKKADVGIAVEGATDAAKSAASIVLTKSGLSVIIDAIKESRKIFQRMYNYSLYRIASTVGALFFIGASIILYNLYPITAFMIVLLMILNDAPMMTIAYDNVKYSAKPEKWEMKKFFIAASIMGFISALDAFFMLYIGKNCFHFNTEILQAFVYLKLSISGHFMLLIVRTKSFFWSIMPAKVLLLAMIITQLIATLITVYGIFLPAIGWKMAGFVWLEAIISFLLIDFLKTASNKKLNLI